ncbi:hypothetical protein XENOCAPTIV_015285 [Xenoophorus captivus]|uniref:ERO1-like protein alpha n=1 Tax=Xenoophorus captivus TaxID=1517983 RepID=A0ABV0QJ64_9TELE
MVAHVSSSAAVIVKLTKTNCSCCGCFSSRSFPLHFDETSLFAGDEKEAGKLKGLGTALKILFSERQIEALPQSREQRPSFQLSRQEVVSLLNAFGRWESEIQIGLFKNRSKKDISTVLSLDQEV